MTEVENGVRRALCLALCPAILDRDACCPTPRGNQANQVTRLTAEEKARRRERPRA